MQILLVSDIHANLQALEAVIAAAPQFDVVWNLGDIVGYGANPNEVVNRVRKLGGFVVCGNHDRACSGGMTFRDVLNFSWLASCSADWTEDVLSSENKKWLSQLPRGGVGSLERNVLRVHGAPHYEDHYILNEIDARTALKTTSAKIIFFGHTHRQEGWISKRHKPVRVRPQFQSHSEAEKFELPLQEKHRYLVNPGSVGQPRDGDWRAAFAVYDDARSLLTWYRVPYKVRTAQRRILRAGLPEILATRLRNGT